LLFFKIIGIGLTGLVMASCTQIQTTKVAEKTFVLTQPSNEPPLSLSTNRLEDKAWEVCPTGFDVLTKNGYKKGQLGLDHAQCVSGMDCDFTLEWKIKCSIRPREEYSIFGSH